MPTATVNPSLPPLRGAICRPRLGGVTRSLGQVAHERGLAMGARALLAAALGACLTAAAASARPAVSTDRTGYFPGDTVIVTGGGWLPYEVVTLTFVEIRIRRGPGSFMAIADSAGRIRNDEYVIGEHDPDGGFTLFAYGEASDLLATATITYGARGPLTAGSSAGGVRAPARQEPLAQPLHQSTSPGSASPASNGSGSAATEPSSIQAGN